MLFSCGSNIVPVFIALAGRELCAQKQAYLKWKFWINLRTTNTQSCQIWGGVKAWSRKLSIFGDLSPTSCLVMQRQSPHIKDLGTKRQRPKPHYKKCSPKTQTHQTVNTKVSGISYIGVLSVAFRLDTHQQTAIVIASNSCGELVASMELRVINRPYEQ